MDWIDPFVAAGLINTLLLSIAAAVAARRDGRWRWIAAMCALLFLILSAILVQHSSEGRLEGTAVAVEQLAWLTGPLLFGFVREAVGYRATLRSTAGHFIVPALVLVVGTPLILIARFEPLPIESLILFQLGYTLASMLVFIRRPERRDRSLLGFAMPMGAIAIMGIVHIGQILRWSPWGDSNVDTVPVIASVAVLVALLLIAVAPQLLNRAAPKYARSSLEPAAAQQLFDAAQANLRNNRLFTRADLSLGDLAAAMNIGVHRLSQALSEGGSTSFNEILTLLRLEEAKRLLVEPRNRSIAVEPIGMEAGFRSRSVFYASFKKHTGLTPVEFRSRHAKSVS